MSISNYAELAFLNTFRNVSFSVATVYIRLHTGNPGEDGTANGATNSVRKIISFSAAASGSMASSAGVIWYNVSTAETYSHFSLWDAASGGNCLWYGALSSSAAVLPGDTFQITSLTLSLD